LPARSAAETQKTCSRECRRRRRRRLARQRRAQCVQDYRVDERERQRRSRARRRAEAAKSPPTGPPCHAPASDAKSAELAEKVLESWDRAVTLSRASLERRMPAILREFGVFSGQARAVTSALSRAGLGPQAPELP